MIDPVVFTIHLGSIEFALRWYGVLVMLGVIVGGTFANKEVTRRGGDGEVIWDAMIWLLPIGILGARLWYVVNATIGGNPYYINNPIQIINIPQGGLHFFGGLVFGAITLYIFLKQKNLDFWLFLDSIAPAALLGQAVARPANFINQELYGQPTTLPWGIKIDAIHRLPLFNDLQMFPVETTRFHPTFAYEMIWNIIGFLIIMVLIRKVSRFSKPGSAFVLWLLIAGIGRTFIEFFRPDQPILAVGWLTTSMLVSFLMALVGLVLVLLRIGVLPWKNTIFPDQYTLALEDK
jgi:phosphatidylglycerol:prolipoprotein diacylglycerol transferase